MPQTGYTPIQIYSSSTPTNAPSAGNLTNDTKGSELAINIADKNLFFKDSSNVVNTVPIRQSGAASDGWLSSTDWNTFNNKQPAGTYVTSVSGTAPVVSSGGTTPAISMAAATTSVNGYLTSTDWNTFNGKQAALVSGTNIKTVGGVSLLGSGDVGTIGVGYGGTGTATTFTAGSVVFAGSSGIYTQDNANLFWNDSSNRLGINNAAPAYPLDVTGQSRSTTGWAVSTDGSAFTPSGLNAIPNYGVGYITSTSTTTLAGFGGLAFYTSQAERVRFFQSGGVSIGNTTDPGATNLSVSGTGKFGTTVGVGAATPAASGAGITFPATASASSDANTLDDYEEGTWTPTWTGLTTSGSSLKNTGYYVKVGRIVYYTVFLQYSTSIATTQGTTYHTLPFTMAYSSANMASNESNGAVNYSGIGLTYVGTAVAYVPTVGATNATICFTGTYYSA